MNELTIIVIIVFVISYKLHRLHLAIYIKKLQISKIRDAIFCYCSTLRYQNFVRNYYLQKFKHYLFYKCFIDINK